MSGVLNVADHSNRGENNGGCWGRTGVGNVVVLLLLFLFLLVLVLVLFLLVLVLVLVVVVVGHVVGKVAQRNTPHVS